MTAPARGALSRWLRYLATASLVTVALVGGGWPFVSAEARRGLLLAGGTALPLQLALFGGLVRQRSGSPGFMAAWIGGTFLRLLAVVGVTVWAVRSESVDTLSAMLALVGLLFVLLLLEPWALREERETDSNGTKRA